MKGIIFFSSKVIAVPLWIFAFVWTSTASASSSSYQYQAYQKCKAAEEMGHPYGTHPDSCAAPVYYDPGGTYKGKYSSLGCSSFAGWNCTSDEGYAYAENHVWRYNTNCATDETFNPDTGECEVDETYESCQEQGKLWDKRIEACIDACPNGELNGSCLQPEPVGDPNLSEDGTECTPDSQDWQGVFEGKAYCDSNLPEPATCPEGQMAYIINEDGSGAYACGAPIKTPEETPQQETENTTTTTDENGNTVTTTTDNAGNTTTTTTDPSGNSSTTINYNGTDSETGEPCSASSVSCYETPDTEKGLCKDGGSLCDDVNDIKKALKNKSDRTTKTGEFPTETEAKIAAAESELSTGLDQIKAEIGLHFDLSLTAGDMVCGPGVEVLGRTLQICPSTMKEELTVIAQIVLLMAAVISLMIVFR